MIFKSLSDSNALHVLRSIWLTPAISRTDIARVVGIDQSTVSRIVTMLIDENIVETVSQGPSGPQGGRKPVFLRLNPRFGCVVGIEMQSEEFTIIGINPIGDILFTCREKYPDSEQPLLSLFSSALQRVRAAVGKTGLNLLGIGVGFPGIINSRDGIILRSNPLEIDEPLRFVERIVPFTSVPVRIEHDARCCCWAELTFHRGRCPANFLYVLGEYRRNKLLHAAWQGIALGLGLVFGHRIYTGEHFAAGEFRSVFYNNRQDTNGLFGIPDAELALLRVDPGVQERFGRELGRNLALLVNVLNLTRVFVGGSIEELGSALLDRIREEVKNNWLYQQQSSFEVEFTQLGGRAVAYGAAGMFLEHLFSPPQSGPSLHELLERSRRGPEYGLISENEAVDAVKQLAALDLPVSSVSDMKKELAPNKMDVKK
ncbi:MAG: ROK family transcriptional regulator [Chloroflexota bacterium]